ncbi:MAG: hypothetical protein K2M44_00640 [Clostridia bacterium]|nr:hypothetical protein [Clostridia bacterium]
MGRKSYKENSLKTRKILVCVFIVLLAAISFALVVNCYLDGNQAVYGATTETAADYADVVPEGKARLLLGNENLSDEDAYVICIYGDGFMVNQQDKFFEAAKNNAEYVMKQSPLDELEPLIKIYAVGVVSNTDTIQTGSVETDTYFHTHFNVNGIDRLMGYSGGAKLIKLNKVFCPYNDQVIILSNTLKYGGSSSGSVAIVSLATESRDIFMHEFGHSAAKLGDEYWQAGYEYECANKTKQSDPEKVSWKRFIGLNGIGVYPFPDQPSGGDRYYKPSLSCKMYSLDSSEFCEVCKEELRKWLCKKSNITMLFFQKYADEIRVGRYGKDMSEYFIFRKGENEITGDKITKGLTLTYYSADGTVLDEAPNTPGRYKVKATFTGNNTYDACEQNAEYEVLPRLPLIAESKIYDGEPAYVDYVPENADGYTQIKYTYSGKIIYSDTYTENYDSAEPPIIPGEYTVKAQAMNSSGCLEEKTADFVIEHRQNAIVQNRMPRNNDAEKTINYDEVLPWQQELYRTRNIIFAGEGFTVAEQDKLEKLARRATYALRTSRPYADFRNYMDFYYVNTVSKTSGLGSNSYFGLSTDNSGKIVSSQRAFSVSNFLQKKYFSELISMGGRDEFSICIVFVNDVKALMGARDINEEGTRLTIYVPANQDGIDCAVKELANTIIGKDEGYMPSSAAEKAEYIKLFRASFFYRSPSAQCPFIADDYNQTFAYTGSPIDFSDYFHVYIEGTAFDNSLISQYFSFTYYADENGYPGEKLSTAPYKVGTYFISAQLMPTRPGYSMDAWSDATNRVEYLMTATAFTRYHIAASGAAVDDGYDDYIDFGGNVGELCEHVFGEWQNEVAADCTHTGIKAHKDCTLCGRHFDTDGKEIKNLLIPASHTLSAVPKQDSTCTAQGTLAHEHCLVCGKDFIDGAEKSADELIIAAIGHGYGAWSIVKQATCSVAGSQKRICTKCNHEEIQTIAIDVNAHTWGEWTIDKAATCTEKGERTRVCAHNSAHRQTHEIAAEGHSWNPEATRVEPTCTTNGYIRGTCMTCGTTTAEVLPALGHDYDNEFTVDKQPTVTEKGSKSKHCSRCDSKTEITEIDMLKSELVMHDKNGGEILVAVSTPDGFSPDIELVVTEIAEDNYTEYNAIAETVNGEIASVYDVTLQIDGVSFQLGGTLTIKLRIPENLLGKEFKLFHLHDGAAVDMEYTIDGAYAIVTTDNLSEFIFVSEKTIEPHPDNALPIAAIAGIAIGAIIAVLIGICTIYYFVSYRKRRYGR